MILSRLSTEHRLARLQPLCGWTTRRAIKSYRLYLLPFLLTGSISACGPKKPVIPNSVEAIARRCYATVATPEHTPQLNPSESMEDGTFLILWSITELPDKRGSCIVDSSGTVLLLTSNADEQPPAPPAPAAPAAPSAAEEPAPPTEPPAPPAPPAAENP